MGCGPDNGRCVRPTEWPLLDPLPPEARRRLNEFRRLFDALLLGARHTLASLLRWSTWRRKHQHRARQCHYRRREHQ